MKKARLILGGGSAYGLAHIGVVKAISESYEISGVIGTSMGAIIGGCLACSIPPQDMLELAEDVSTLELFNPLNLDFSRSGIFDGKAITRMFEKWTDSRHIEHTDIPFIAVAFDLHRQITVLIDKGLCADAMRASSSLPFIFAPHEMSDYVFVDGGVAHPLPLAFADKVPGEITIAANVLPPVSFQAEFYESGKKKKKDKLNRYDVFLHSLMQNQGFMAIQSIVQYKPDIIIDAHHPEHGFTDLEKAAEFYEFGLKAAQKAISKHDEPGFAAKLRGNYEELLKRIVTRRKT
jgi:NTE family protein